MSWSFWGLNLLAFQVILRDSERRPEWNTISSFISVQKAQDFLCLLSINNSRSLFGLYHMDFLMECRSHTHPVFGKNNSSWFIQMVVAEFE